MVLELPETTGPDRGLAVAVHWGADLGDLSQAELDALALAARPQRPILPALSPMGGPP